MHNSIQGWSTNAQHVSAAEVLGADHTMRIVIVARHEAIHHTIRPDRDALRNDNLAPPNQTNLFTL